MEAEKEKRPALADPFPNLGLACRDYPFVTTGGGGAAQPAIVARVSTAMIAKASFFIDHSPRCYERLHHSWKGANA